MEKEAPVEIAIDPALEAAAFQQSQIEAAANLVGKMLDHIYTNRMATAKVRGARLEARHAGVTNYHLSPTVQLALRRAPPVKISSGRSRDYGKIQPHIEADGTEVPAFAAVNEKVKGLLESHRLATAKLPPYDRAVALAQLVMDTADELMSLPSAASAGKAVRRKETKYQSLLATVDKWTEAATVACELFLRLSSEIACPSHGCGQS